MLLHKYGLKFAFVGAGTAFIYYALLYSLVSYSDLSILFSSALAYILVIILNYMMQYQWTFRSTTPHKVAIRRFIFMNIGGFIINLSIMVYGQATFSEHYLIVQTVAIIFIVVWNFVFSSLWVYKDNQFKGLI